MSHDRMNVLYFKTKTWIILIVARPEFHILFKWTIKKKKRFVFRNEDSPILKHKRPIIVRAGKKADQLLVYLLCPLFVVV